MDSVQTTEPIGPSSDVTAAARGKNRIDQQLWTLLQLPLIAVGSGALLWLLITRLPATMGEMPLVGIWLQLILLAYMGAMIWLFVRPLALRWRTNAILLLLALFFLTILTIKLKNTPFTVGGINGDARFYTTYVTKLAAYPGYGDMFYKDLPAFYPPLYFWLVGRGADWFGIEPFRVMKTGLLVTVLILPLVTGALWRRLVDERLAAAVALCMLVFPDWFKPNEWLALALFVPWWLHWVDNVTAYRPATPRTTLLWWLSGGLIGALIFQLYFFWFFVGGVTLAVKVGWWLCCRRREHQLRWSLLQSGGMLTLTALLSAPFWVPYLYSLLTTPGAEPLQNRFFGESKIPLPLYFFEASWQGVVYMGGLLYLFLAAATNRVLWGLRWLVIGFAVWVVLGYVGILVDMPLLTFRSYPMLLYLLGASAFLGLFQLWHNAEAIQRRWPIFPVRTLATLLLLLVVLLFANGAVTELQEQENVQDALAATYPATELAAFDQLTAQTYLDRVVWVTDGYRSILFFRPVYSFLAWSAHFSHPAGQFHARADFLEKLAQLHDPALFAQAFAQNQYDRINYILLSRDEEYWRFSFVDDNFPNRMIDREINFPARLLAEPFFRASTVGEYTMLKPTVVEPLAMTPTATAAMSLDDVARLYVLTTRFAPDIALADGAATAASAEQQLLTGDLTTLSVELLFDLRTAATGALAVAVQEAMAGQLGLAEPIALVDETGQPRLQLLGYQLQPNAEKADVTVSLYFATVAPLDEDYGIWFHTFVEGQEKRTFDHDPVLPTTRWPPGLIYRDQFTISVPPGTYRLETGLWHAESDRRLLPPTGDFGVTFGTVVVP